jgi:hypothetical protein
MTAQTKVASVLCKALISATALATASTMFAAPAFAGGRHGGHHYRPQHYSYGYYPAYRQHDYYGYRNHRRGHISAGEGALIAAGIIGGVILIDRALADRDRYDNRYDDRRYDDRYEQRGAFNDDYYYQRDSRDYDRDRDYDRYVSRPDAADLRSDSDPDDRLLGEERSGGGATILADAAFRECVAETRGAAGAGGMSVAMPGAPTEVEQLADGSVRMTAQFRASNPRGESWTRRFVCEADEQGVRFLQVD